VERERVWPTDSGCCAVSLFSGDSRKASSGFAGFTAGHVHVTCHFCDQAESVPAVLRHKGANLPSSRHFAHYSNQTRRIPFDSSHTNFPYERASPSSAPNSDCRAPSP